jgi:ABC-type siderophore export system fused ATPase/permease subunit
VIVISHDDRYFDVADRRITMQRGRIVQELTRSTQIERALPAVE